ncbi:MAG: hypothetical protein ACKVPX_08605 [Myxococcaceae bacterium]
MAIVPKPEFSTTYYAVSGPSYDRCCFLAERHPADVESARKRVDESIVVAISPKKEPGQLHVNLVRISNDWHCGLWLSPDETLFVATQQDRVLRMPKAFRPELTHTDFQVDNIRSTLTDIWGLTDDCVFTWGIRGVGDDQEYPIFRFDGTQWNEMPSPGFEVYAMHGLSPNLIWAVGDGVAFWNGSQWKQFPAPGPERYVAVFVAAPDEVYAVGRVNSFVIEGGPHGFQKIGDPEIPLGLDAVVKWKGDLWIGAESAGLFKRVGKSNKLELLEKGVRAKAFDVRKDFVICCYNVIAATQDGKKFVAAARDSVLEIRGDKALHEP